MQASQEVGNIDSQSAGAGLVRHMDALEWHARDHIRWARVFGVEDGTRMLSLYACEVGNGKREAVQLGNSEAVIYALTGSGLVSVGGREFDIEGGDGLHVRAGESCQLSSAGSEKLRLLMAVCPSGENEPWQIEGRHSETSNQAFDAQHPERRVSSSGARRETSGDRYFKVLVGPKIGSNAVTQFIGSIPRSRAPEHFHEYEEVICVLSGEGVLWIDDVHEDVRPGSLIFLPPSSVSSTFGPFARASSHSSSETSPELISRPWILLETRTIRPP